MAKKVLIIGAGPAGLSLAHKILKDNPRDFEIEIFEASNAIGGISQTINNNGNRMDIGGHRFFSKSDIVMRFWREILPLESPDNSPKTHDKVLMIRTRLSRIYFHKKLFSYPLKLSFDLVRNLGILRCVKIAFSYAKAIIFPYKTIDSLEKFYINRFGRELYRLFFESYTEKVWGKHPRDLSPDWGAQRVKGLSIAKAILGAIKARKNSSDIAQKNVETSLIERFLYPKFGPGQLWECVADEIIKLGGAIHKNARIVGLNLQNNRVESLCVEFLGESNGNSSADSCKNADSRQIRADFIVSTMPIKDLFTAMPNAPQNIAQIAKNLEYRDFLTIGVLLKGTDSRDSRGDSHKDSRHDSSKDSKDSRHLRDNWIYIQEPFVRVARLQFFHNWSPYLLANPKNRFVGMEYMCDECGDLWNMSDENLGAFGANELTSLGFAQKSDIIATHIVRVKKAYPSYSGAYSEFGAVREYLDSLENLFVCGRNGMHRYNNMDHSMLSAFAVAECIVKNAPKSAIWEVNAEESYIESK